MEQVGGQPGTCHRQGRVAVPLAAVPDVVPQRAVGVAADAGHQHLLAGGEDRRLSARAQQFDVRFGTGTIEPRVVELLGRVAP